MVVGSLTLTNLNTVFQSLVACSYLHQLYNDKMELSCIYIMDSGGRCFIMVGDRMYP